MKKCKECKHGKFLDEPFFNWHCYHPENSDLVSGSIRCAVERDEGNCGPDGKLFEQKPPEPKNWLSRLFGS